MVLGYVHLLNVNVIGFPNLDKQHRKSFAHRATENRTPTLGYPDQVVMAIVDTVGGATKGHKAIIAGRDEPSS
jgi:hypothetical protein